MKIQNATLCFFLFIFLTAKAQHGTHPAWGTAIEIPKAHESGSARGEVGNTMVINSDEKIIAFFSETYPFPGNSSSIYWVTSDDGGQTWSVPQLFEPTQKVIGGCCFNIALDTLDQIHVVWQSKLPKAIFYSKLDKDLHLLTDTLRIADSFKYAPNALTLTVDRKNRVHVMWHDGDPKTPGQVAEIQYTRSPDGGQTWETPRIISQDDHRHSAFPRADFSGTRSDTLAIAWRDSISMISWNVVVAISPDGGQTWTPTTPLDIPGRQWDPGIVVDKQGYFQLNFHEYPLNDPFNGARVKFGTSKDHGNTWSDFQVISDDVRSQLTTYNYDYANDRLWVFWKDERDYPGVDIMANYSNDRGATWLDTPEFITDYGDNPVGFKSSAVSPNGTVAINYERPDTESGLSTLFFQKRDDLTALSPTPPTSGGNLIVFPNPSNGTIHLQIPDEVTDDAKLTLFNLAGQPVFSKTISTNTPIVIIHFPALPPGAYFMILSGPSFMFTQKIFLLQTP